MGGDIVGKASEITFLRSFCCLGEQRNGLVSSSECGVENVLKG